MDIGTSLEVQWLILRAPNAGGMGSIPGRGTQIPHAAWPKKKKKVMFTLYYSLLSVQRHYVLKKKKPSIYTLILK